MSIPTLLQCFGSAYLFKGISSLLLCKVKAEPHDHTFSACLMSSVEPPRYGHNILNETTIELRRPCRLTAVLMIPALLL